ncbi:cysteine desulfurase [Blautia liquoris]|uniref:Cysteine desulfurase n=1 Tax=Blautia liquoris TaxID=2779518 RepID=A0A7M2RGU3_9FIRM|nr:cysteine desulfurase [Blautia liquoris]QOV19459.1 cysteine desulfurase [Blautia liquoris]
MNQSKLLHDFPVLAQDENGKKLSYLDNAATTQRPVQVLDAVKNFYETENANPYRGVYELAAKATEAHEHARSTVAEFINADHDEVIFTQGTTEGLNLIAYSYGLNFLKDGDEIVISVAEHHSNLVPWQRVAKATGAVLKYMYLDDSGRITDEEIEKKIGSNTRLVAIAQVSNVLGLEAPIEKIVKKAHAVGAVVVMDCAQSLPHIPVDVRKLDVDFAALSGHKIYGPMGIGALYGKKELLEKMPPFLSGGDMIQSVHEQSVTYGEVPRKFEAGTRNVGGEVGLEAAINYVKEIGYDEIIRHEHELIEYAIDQLRDLPYVTIYGEPSDKLRHGVIAFNIDDVHPHDTATILDAEGVAVRAGHHCAQPLMDYLHITACARASFAIYNTKEDVDALIRGIKNVRRYMGFGD